MGNHFTHHIERKQRCCINFRSFGNWRTFKATQNWNRKTSRSRSTFSPPTVAIKTGSISLNFHSTRKVLNSEKLYMKLLTVSNRWSDDYNKTSSCGHSTCTLCESISTWDTCVRCRQRKSLLGITSFFPTTQC